VELIGIESSKITALFLVSRPEGQPYLPATLHALVERYSFAKHPTKIDELMEDRVSFGHGVFEKNRIDQLDIYPDGVLIQSKCSTDVLDAFLNDVIMWSESALGLKRIETARINRSYESQLFVRSESSILTWLSGLSKISALIGQYLKESTNMVAEFEAFGFSIATDTTRIPSLRPINFRIERKIDIPFERNIFISSAPLTTANHQHVLQALEDLANKVAK
jgi:hypothetical protein